MDPNGRNITVALAELEKGSVRLEYSDLNHFAELAKKLNLMDDAWFGVRAQNSVWRHRGVSTEGTQWEFIIFDTGGYEDMKVQMFGLLARKGCN